jgi:hypothetical protein
MKINTFFAIVLVISWICFLYFDKWSYHWVIQITFSGMIGVVVSRLMISEPFVETETRCIKEILDRSENKDYRR